MKACAVILGGGSGTRMGAKQNKIFLPLPGRARYRAGSGALYRPVRGSRRGSPAGRAGRHARPAAPLRAGFLRKEGRAGGSTRQESVRHGLDALPGDTDIVLIHDGARALVTEDVIRRAMESAAERGSGVAAIPVTDTIKRVDSNGRALETLNRDELRAMQTPQAFRLSLLRQAHEKAEKDGFLGTDDAALLEHAGLPVYLTLGDPENLKLTTPADLALARPF